jgi:phage terminase large subunit
MNEIRINLQEKIGKGFAEFWHTKKRYRINVGGRASKKSTNTAIWFIVHLMKIPNSNLLVIRKFFKDHKDSTYAQLAWACNYLGVAMLWDFKLSPLEIIYRVTGQKILFRGLDDPQSITSITVENGFICWCWFEEFFQITNEADFDMIDGSIRGAMPEPLFKQITGTLNPWNERHWIKKRFFDNQDDDTFTLTTTYLQNEFLDENDIKMFENMKERNPRRYNVEGLGRWGVAEGLIFDNWEEREFDYLELLKDNPALELCNGLDFGYNADPTALVSSLIDLDKKKLWIFDEHYQKGMLNNQIAAMIQYKGLDKSEIVADCAEPKSIDEIKGLGVRRIRPAKKGQDSVNNGIQFLQQFEIIVHPKCVNTILELNNYAWDTKNGRMLNKPIDDFNHCIDAIRYSVEKYTKTKKLKAVTALRY